jgi:4-amino-4-deoxy-L-arabinose transferase-like glycosyltransferase
VFGLDLVGGHCPPYKYTSWWVVTTLQIIKILMNIYKYLSLLDRFPRSSLLLLTLPLLLFNPSQQSLLAHDEGFYAVQARWIWESGDWLTPQWWGKPIYDRTIGLQWLMAASYHLFGLNEFAARLPSTIACICSVLSTYEIGKILLNQRIAWLGGLILMLMGLWVSEAHTAQQNTALVAIELLGIWALLKLTDLQSIRLVTPRIKFGWGLLLGATVGLGFMIKGFMIFVPIMALLPYLFLQQRYQKLITNPGLYLGLIVGAMPTGLWLLFSYYKYGLMPVQELVNKLLFLSKTSIYDPGPFYYLWNLPANIFPWALFSLIGAIVVWRRLLADLNYSVLSLTLGYPILLFVLLSSFKTRMPYYTMQLLPFMALLAATALVKFTQVSRYRDSKTHWYRLMTVISYAFSGLGLLLAIAAILIMINRPLWGMAIPPEIRIYAIPALMLGCGWASIAPLWLRWQPPTTPYWLAAWLVPVWFTLVSLGLQGSLADRTPEFMAAFQQPTIQQALKNNSPVNILSDTVENDGFKASNGQNHFLSGEEHKTLVLLSFYTPHLGKQVPSFTDLPDQSYAWTLSIPPQLATRSRIIGSVQGWKLIQKIS